MTAPDPLGEDEVEALRKALGEVHIDWLEEPLSMNASRDDLDRLARAAILRLDQVREERKK